MTQYNFDDRNINWQKLGDFEHLLFSILDVDLENKVIAVIFKLEAHKPIFLHRHMVLNKSFVIQGEHRLYESNGVLKESRPVGSYTISPADDAPHRECGGDDGAIVLFSIQASDDILYEILDDDENVVGNISMQDIIELNRENSA